MNKLAAIALLALAMATPANAHGVSVTINGGSIVICTPTYCTVMLIPHHVPPTMRPHPGH